MCGGGAQAASASDQTDIIQKHSRDDAAVMSDMLAGITDGLKKASWKVGELIPSSWKHGSDFLMAPHNSFEVNELAAIMRSDRRYSLLRATPRASLCCKNVRWCG